MFVLDSDHLSLLQREDIVNPTLEARLLAHDETELWVSIISFHEQILGWHTYLSRAQTPDQLVLGYSRFESLFVAFSDYQVLSFDDSAAEVYSDLRKQRIRVGTMDLRIAAIVISNGMTLLTRNTVDFERIPNLAFEDWTSS